MRQVHLDPEAIHRGDLILVNREHPLKQELCPSERAVLDGSGCALQKRAAVMLASLLQEIGPGIALVSGWRSFDEQQTLFRDSLRRNGERFTRRYVALPGCSEHQTGLAIDLGEAREKIDFLRPDFPDRGACAGFLRRKAEHGFLLRYPAGKERVTGIASEPWHFRYVGVPHARAMEERGLTLEEYVDFLRPFSMEAPFHVENYDVWFVPAQRGRPLLVALPDGRGAVLSGNNVDGMIVTCAEAAG